MVYIPYPRSRSVFRFKSQQVKWRYFYFAVVHFQRQVYSRI